MGSTVFSTVGFGIGMTATPFLLLLSSASASVLRISITALIIALTVSLRFGFPTAMTRSRMAGPLAGFVVGLLLASLGIGGPILVILMLARDWPGRVMRVSLSFYFLLIESAAVVGYGVAGLFTLERIVLMLMATAPVLLGFRLGTLLLRSMNERRFRRGVVTVIMVTSLVVLGREALHLQGVIS